ncbi:hypothetical protein KOR34_00770 [Posidoniimonas corsicana]|uniref:Uncharacterized protein n=1 Tax=Posidoniimonas corsicana TaxID=1938618 RepID=A0A5C5VBJ3_9BACT|nr:phosphoglycerate kinase [Posidoniimonas corsicana]TWT35189.1 hypothetical protein KOR34_00770 [Posidoniimonas corsicana]
MELAMFAFATDEVFDRPVDFLAKNPINLHFWTAHPHLHGWMESLYNRKGGAQVFKGVAVELTTDDLLQLAEDLFRDRLRRPVGLGFGISRHCETEDDFGFIVKAWQALADGNTVYYEASW